MSNETACDNGFVLAPPILLFCLKFVYFRNKDLLPDCCVGQSVYNCRGKPIVQSHDILQSFMRGWGDTITQYHTVL